MAGLFLKLPPARPGRDLPSPSEKPTSRICLATVFHTLSKAPETLAAQGPSHIASHLNAASPKVGGASGRDRFSALPGGALPRLGLIQRVQR